MIRTLNLYLQESFSNPIYSKFKFVDAILNDEFRNGRMQKKEPLATLSLAALPPSFRAIAKQVNENIEDNSHKLFTKYIDFGYER